jgi:hypothetical protein
VLVHAGVLATVATFLALGWWQVRRAFAGNVLSIGYAFEWPVFAGFLIFVWFREVRQALAPTAGASDTGSAGAGAGADERPWSDGTGDNGSALPAQGGRRQRTGPAYDDADDEPLAAYNRYLAWLNANPHATPAEYPG